MSNYDDLIRIFVLLAYLNSLRVFQACTLKLSRWTQVIECSKRSFVYRRNTLDFLATRLQAEPFHLAIIISTVQISLIQVDMAYASHSDSAVTIS